MSAHMTHGQIGLQVADGSLMGRCCLKLTSPQTITMLCLPHGTRLHSAHAPAFICERPSLIRRLLCAGLKLGYDELEYSSRPVPALRADGSPMSLRESVQQTWPALQLDKPSASSANDADNTAPEAPPASEPPAVEPGGDQPEMRPAEARPAAQPSVTINGIDISLDLPVAWLHARLHAADHFLYVIIRT